MTAAAKTISDGVNLQKIKEAFDAGRIDAPARDYLESLYKSGMECFRLNFHFLSMTLGAPKAPLRAYDLGTHETSEKETQIAEVGPSGSYVVHHRFDMDPMRNQFFASDGTDVRLFVSSIVSVIVASQKNVDRAIAKVAGKYYDDYLDEVVGVVSKVLTKHKKSASVAAVSDKIASVFREKFISNPAPEVLRIIGNMFPDISVELVRGLDKVPPPYARLKDVYRMKILFDTVPQINAFIDHARRAMPGMVLDAKNKFYDLGNDRTYRDAKIVVGFDMSGHIIPVEVIMNVRTFFDAERWSHREYESIRSGGKRGALHSKEVNELHHAGIVQYNKIICRAAQYLLRRVGWNIMYERDMRADSVFRGFPEVRNLPYSEKIVGAILDKIDDCVQNEIFRIHAAPRKLSVREEISVFRYVARFILFAALPYSYKFEEIKGMGFSCDLFNFVMKELYRYHENNVL